MLLSNRGLFFGDPGAQRYASMCNDALGITTTDRPALALTADDSLLAGTYGGLFRTRDRGCHWEPVANLGETSVPAVAQVPGEPDHLYVATFGAAASGVLETVDGGQTFRSLMSLGDNDVLNALLMAPSDPSRLYASGTSVTSAGMLSYYVLRSVDSGASWDRLEWVPQGEELGLTLLAVDPSDPDRLIAKATASEPMQMPERLLVSRDAGASFDSPLAVFALVDAAFEQMADGVRVWVAGKQGLWRSDTALESFEQLPDSEEMTCVVQHGDQMLACGKYAGLTAAAQAGKNGVGVLGASGVFEPFMGIAEVVEPVQCAEDSTTPTTCAQPWQDFQREVQGGSVAGGASMSPAAGAGAALTQTAGAGVAPMQVAGAGAAPTQAAGGSAPGGAAGMPASSSAGGPAASGGAAGMVAQAPPTSTPPVSGTSGSAGADSGGCSALARPSAGAGPALGALVALLALALRRPRRSR